MKTLTSSELYARAVKVIPGGVNSPVRAFRAVGGQPIFIARAEGATVWDVDGNSYVDFVGSWGPMILGHADRSVVAKICQAAERGTSYGAPTEGEVELAELIVRRIPSIERVRLTSSGTEAAMSAIRVARGFTERTGIVKFEGCYHGHSDGLLSKSGSGVATLDLPDSAGVPADFTRHTITVPFNDIARVKSVFASRGRDIAAVIVEPIVGNMGCVPPSASFLHELAELAHAAGALLIFDEVITGFRVHQGGAQALFGIKPDLTVLGKIVGGGLPMGAFGGRADLMDRVAPVGPIYQAGTLSGNPCAVAAGLATLKSLERADAYESLERASQKLCEGISDALLKSGVGGIVQRVGSMWTLFFNDGANVKNLDDARECDHSKYARYFHQMLLRGIYLPPSGYETAFVSLAHTDDDIEKTIAAVRSVLPIL